MKLTIAKDELQFGHKQTLNKDFWKDEKLDVEVRLAIMAIVKNFLKTTNLEMTADEIDEIEFTGSLANYNYGKYSDVDIHLLFDFSKIGDDPEFMRDYLTTKAINWNNRHNVTIFGHEVELYITDAGSDHHSTGVYSVKDDKWLVKPVRDTKLSAELNLNKVKDKADKISKEIDMLVSVEGDLSLETIEGLKNKIKKMRVAGLETGGEFSIENLAFKLLRRRGELNTLYALMNQAQDAELSLDEDVEWWKKRRKKDNKNYRELMGHGKRKSVFKKKYAFKNVGKKNKLNRMSGAPYMINPQMKLPKSGPPGVGSLEEQYSQGTISTLNKVINKLDSGEPVEMKLTDMTLSGFECLGPHSYTLKKSGDSYSIKLKQSVSSILSQQAKTMKGAGDFKPLEKCVYKAGDGIIDDVELKDIILDQLSAGKAEFVFVAPKLPTFKMPDISDIFTTKKKTSSFSKKLMSEKGKIAITLWSKKPVRFTNLPNISDFFMEVYKSSLDKLKDKEGNVDLSKIGELLDFKALFKIAEDSLKKLKPKGGIGYVYYDPSEKRIPKNNPQYPVYIAVFENEKVTTDTSSIVPKAYLEAVVDEALEEIPEGNRLEKLVKKRVGQIVKAIIGRMTGGDKTSKFSKKQLLQGIDEETDGNFCAYFDCKRTKVIKYINGKPSRPITAEQYLRGATFTVMPSQVEFFIGKISTAGAIGFGDLKGGQVWFSNPDKYANIGTPKKPLYLGVYQALFLMVNDQVKDPELSRKIIKDQIAPLAKTQKEMPTENDFATKIQDTFKNNCKGRGPAELAKAALNNVEIKELIPYSDKKDGIKSITIKCEDGTQPTIKIPRNLFVGSPLDIGLMFKAKREEFKFGQQKPSPLKLGLNLQQLLQRKGKKYGFQNFDPKDNTKWYMPMKIADQWKEYNPSEDYSKQTKETLEQLFSFPDNKDVNLDNFIDKTSPKLRLELVKLAQAAKKVFGPNATIAITEALKGSGHVGKSQHKTGDAADFYIGGISGSLREKYKKAYCFTLAAMAADVIDIGGLGIYFKKDGKTLSDKPHYDVRGRNSAWKWIGGKESKTSRKSKTAIIDNNLLNLPEEFIELAKSYRDEL